MKNCIFKFFATLALLSLCLTATACDFDESKDNFNGGEMLDENALQSIESSILTPESSQESTESTVETNEQSETDIETTNEQSETYNDTNETTNNDTAEHGSEMKNEK